MQYPTVPRNTIDLSTPTTAQAKHEHGMYEYTFDLPTPVGTAVSQKFKSSTVPHRTNYAVGVFKHGVCPTAFVGVWSRSRVLCVATQSACT